MECVMMKKFLPVAVIALSMFVACGDDSSSASASTEGSSASAASSDGGAVADTSVHELGAKLLCNRKTVEYPVTAINAEANYDLENEILKITAVVTYDSSATKDEITAYCEDFAKTYGFTENECEGESESGNAISTVSLKKEGVDVDSMSAVLKPICTGEFASEE